MLIFEGVILAGFLAVLRADRAGFGMDVENQIRLVRTHLAVVSKVVHVCLRCDESTREANLKLSRLEWTDVNAHGNGTIRVQRLKDVVDEVARRDVILVSAVKYALNLMKRRRHVDPAIFLDGCIERTARIGGFDVVLFQYGRRVF